MYGDYIRNAEFAAYQQGSVAARQRSMGVDQINGLVTMKFPHSSHDSRESERAGSGKSNAPRQRQIAEPFRRLSALTSRRFCAIHGLYRKHCASHSQPNQTVQRFRDETAARIIMLVGIERR